MKSYHCYSEQSIWQLKYLQRSTSYTVGRTILSHTHTHIEYDFVRNPEDMINISALTIQFFKRLLLINATSRQERKKVMDAYLATRNHVSSCRFALGKAVTVRGSS